MPSPQPSYWRTSSVSTTYAAKGWDTWSRRYKRTNRPWQEGVSRERMSMELFLDSQEEFEYAYTLYAYQNCTGRISQHNVRGNDIALDQVTVGAFQEAVQEHFASFAKGNDSEIRTYWKTIP